MSFQDLYQKALAHRKSFTLVHSAALLLAWDQETGMPVKAGIHRAETMGELSKISHGLSTQTFYGDFLAELWENRDQGSEDQDHFLKIVKDITSKGFVRNNYKKNLVDLSDVKISLKGKK